jgi:cell division protein FtsB
MYLMPDLKRLKHIILSFVFLLMAVNFTKTTIELWKHNKRLENLQQEVGELRAEREGLEESIAHKQTPEYVEEMARNELNLVLPGEKVYVVTEDTGGGSEGVKEGGSRAFRLGDVLSSQSNIAEGVPESENWYLWFRLFF